MVRHCPSESFNSCGSPVTERPGWEVGPPLLTSSCPPCVGGFAFLAISGSLSSTFAVFHLTLVFKGFTALVPQGPDEPNPLFSRVFEADARKTAKVELRAPNTTP